ncbi:hypothetical protein ACSBR2_029219 [Camellia fascicularis]
MSGYTQAMVVIEDNYGNTILHLAGGLAPYDKLNLVLGAALQMQRELQWFKEVERFVAPHYKELPNKKDEIPLMFPLLVDLISSTYCPHIFGKQNDQPFY